MVRAPDQAVDPARDAAALVRRIAFLVLAIVLPVVAFTGRDGPVIVFAVAALLVIGAAAFDGGARAVRISLAGLLASPGFMAILLVVGWSVLSLLWTPDRPSGRPAALGLAAVVALAFAAFLALPDRMRAANLYLMPIGVGIAALVGLALAVAPSFETPLDAARRLDRGLAVTALSAWPALGWLRSRGRDGEAIGLALLVAVAAAFGSSLVPAAAFGVGAVAYLATQAGGRLGATAVAVALAGLIGLAPALLALDLPAALAARAPSWAAAVAPWRDTLLGDPVRLLTGHGIGSLAALAAPPPANAFGTALLATWYELGALGALGLAAATGLALTGAVERFGPLLPALSAAFATAVVLALAGIDGGAAWWPVALASAALGFVAATRGQFRTRRPRALGLGRSRAAA